MNKKNTLIKVKITYKIKIINKRKNKNIIKILKF